MSATPTVPDDAHPYPVGRSRAKFAGLLCVVGGLSSFVGAFLPVVDVYYVNRARNFRVFLESENWLHLGGALFETVIAVVYFGIAVSLIALGAQRLRTASASLQASARAMIGAVIIAVAVYQLPKDSIVTQHGITAQIGVGCYLCWAGMALVIVGVQLSSPGLLRARPLRRW